MKKKTKKAKPRVTVGAGQPNKPLDLYTFVAGAALERGAPFRLD